MALIICPECGHEISDAAAACPNCGFPLDRLKNADVQVVRTVTPAAPAGETILVRRRGFALSAAILGTVALVVCGGFAIGHVTPDLSFSVAVEGSLIWQAVYLTVAAACNWVGFFSRYRSLVLAAGIFYCLALAAWFLLGVFFVTLPLIFSFVGYARMKPKRMTIEEYMAD